VKISSTTLQGSPSFGGGGPASTTPLSFFASVPVSFRASLVASLDEPPLSPLDGGR
jgi:hypothetical protein